jgi:hypothetical protein
MVKFPRNYNITLIFVFQSEIGIFKSMGSANISGLISGILSDMSARRQLFGWREKSLFSARSPDLEMDDVLGQGNISAGFLE